MILDLFEMEDSLLLHDNFAQWLEFAIHLGALDEYEYKALEPFWVQCSSLGLKFGGEYVPRVPSDQVKVMLSTLVNYKVPDNVWHQELKEKVIRMLQHAASNENGILGFS